MKILGVIWAVCVALAVNECGELSPWAARKIGCWSAHLRYADSSRAEIRAEELTALIDGRPGKLFKLITALCFAVAAIWAWARRATVDVSLVSITPVGQGMLRKATVVSVAVLAAAAMFPVLRAMADTPPTPGTVTTIIPLRALARGSTTGEATASTIAGGWSIQLTVKKLPPLRHGDARTPRR